MDRDLTGEHLDVYDTKEGPWNPDHGDLEIPEDWDFLPRGDAFVTRTVKAAGPYWTAWQPRSRNRPHRRKLGLWAPRANIDAARVKAEQTQEARARQRAESARNRARAEERYREELEAAIVTFLAFAPEHAALAREIAREAVARAAVVGSGRVGRTRKLAIEDRAALAARAYIRHRHTDYETNLDDGVLDADRGDDFLYREVKANAHAVVDTFLEKHRPH